MTEQSDNIPVPDPTRRSIEMLEREIQHLRELVAAKTDQISWHLDAADSQLDQRFSLQITDIRRQVEAKFSEQDRAVQAALVAADKAVTALDISTTQRMEALQALNESKFVTYRTLLDSQAAKVQIALDADNKLVDSAFGASKDAIQAAFDSSKEAIQKAEVFNEKRFELMSKQIEELKTVQSLNAGKGAGASAMVGFIVGAVGFVATVLAIILAVSNFN